MDDLNIRFGRARDARGRFAVMDGIQAQLIEQLQHDAARDIVGFAEDQAKTNAPARTGNLKRSIRSSPIAKVGNVYMGGVEVGARYGKWVESGTGIYGPFGMPIRPKVGNVLAWRAFNPMVRPGQEGMVYAAWVRGQPGQHYVRRAYEATERVYTPVRLQVLGQAIRTVLST